MSYIVRCTATALILACLTAGTAQAWPAAQVRPAIATPEAGGLLDAAWKWLALVIRPAPKPNQQRKYGCGMDPNGKPAPCQN
ncbi:MAG TPA: hypothetical protein VKK31_08125 [Thermoanaerobaculia bacterium]|nr:hypothetical protein [Thermoanaerobaculia bacterium]